jgi:hypothetical protein
MQYNTNKRAGLYSGITIRKIGGAFGIKAACAENAQAKSSLTQSACIFGIMPTLLTMLAFQ